MVGAALMSGACSSMFSGDGAAQPKPLPALASNAADMALAWQANIGASDADVQRNFLFDLSAGKIYAATAAGKILILDASSGQIEQTFHSKERLSAAIAADALGMYVVNQKAELIALDERGGERWRKALGALPLGRPFASGGRLLVQTQDGRVQAFHHDDGRSLWSYRYHLPSLTLQHGGSMQPLGDEVVLLGMAGGRVAVLSMVHGEVLWEAPIAGVRGANELERMADVASPPIFDGTRVCAAAFQGRTSCLDARTGAPLWSQPIASSHALAMDVNAVYVVDDDGKIHALDRQNGRILWQQDALLHRGLSAPAVLQGRVFVLDQEGYAHVLNAQTGAITGRLATGAGAAVSRLLPIAADRVLVHTQTGRLLAFRP